MTLEAGGGLTLSRDKNPGLFPDFYVEQMHIY